MARAMERAWHEVDAHGASWVAEPAPEPSDDEPQLATKGPLPPGCDERAAASTPRTRSPSSRSGHDSRSPSSAKLPGPSSRASSCSGSPLSRKASNSSLWSRGSASPESFAKRPSHPGTPLSRQPSRSSLPGQGCASPASTPQRPPRQPYNPRTSCPPVFCPAPRHASVFSRPPRPQSDAKLESPPPGANKRCAVERRTSAPAAPSPVRECVISTAAEAERSPSSPDPAGHHRIQSAQSAREHLPTARSAASPHMQGRQEFVPRQIPPTASPPRPSSGVHHQSFRASSCPVEVRSFAAKLAGGPPVLHREPPVPHREAECNQRQPTARHYVTTPARSSRVSSQACRVKRTGTTSTPRFISMPYRAGTPRTSFRAAQVGNAASARGCTPPPRHSCAAPPSSAAAKSMADRLMDAALSSRMRSRVTGAAYTGERARQHFNWTPFSLEWLHQVLQPQDSSPQSLSGHSPKLRRPSAGALTDISPSDIQFLEKIGTGSFGAVWRATFRGQEVAVKQCKVGDLKDTHMLLKEIQCLQSLRHPCLVSFLGCCNRPPHVLMLMEYMPGGSLYDLLFKRRVALDFEQKCQMASEVAEGLSYIHGLSVVHRDLKTANIVLDKALRCKICDFGLTIALEHTHLTVLSLQGSPRYMAPEQFEPAARITDKVDIWQFGCVMLELFCVVIPFRHCTGLQQIARELLVHKRPPSLPNEADLRARTLVQACCRIAPTTRPAAVALHRALFALWKGHVEA